MSTAYNTSFCIKYCNAKDTQSESFCLDWNWITNNKEILSMDDLTYLSDQSEAQE
jgi:hypothetical protein